MALDDWLTIRARLQGARETQAGLAATAAEIRAVGSESVVTGRKMDSGGRSAVLYGQAMYTVRRSLFAVTSGLAAAGAGALVLGIKFNASMEQNRISLGYFLGSTRAANTELASLYQLAAKTPFQFSDVTDAARRFLAFGFTLRQTNSYLRTLGDTAAGLGLGSSDVARLAIIIGQIRSSGRLLGQDTLQLAQAGINARGILQQQLGLSAQQMSALGAGTLTIPSSVAIPALMRGLQAQFRGMSAAQANTGAGLASTAKDYASQFFGVLTSSLFDRGKQNLKTLNALLSQATHILMPTTLGGQGGTFLQALTAIDKGAGANGQLVTSWKELKAVGTDVGLILRGSVIPAFVILWKTVGLGSPPMRLLIGLLGVVAHHMTATMIVVGLLSSEMIYNRAVMLLTLGATKGLTIGYFLLGRAILAVRGAMFLLNLAMAANPVGLIILGVAALAAGLVVLYLKWGAFHRAVDATFGWIRSNWPLLLAIITGPIGLAIDLATGHFGRLKREVGAVVDWIAGKFRALAHLIPSLWSKIPGHGLISGAIHLAGSVPGLATGGTVLTGGAVAVGERGPEILHLPAGATVKPLDREALGRMINIIIHPGVAEVKLNGVAIAEAAFTYQAAVQGRA